MAIRIDREKGILLLSFALALLLSSCGGGGGGGSAESPPIVSTNGPADVTTSSAKMNGEVNPNGLQTYAWFEWGTDINLVVYSATDNLSIGNGVSNSPWSATIPVSAGGTYYYRIVASNPEGVSRGGIVSFRAYQLPAPATTAAASITLNSADLNGTVNPNGFETYGWFEYGEDPSLSSSVASDNQLIGSGSTPIPLQATISGLTPYTTYYFRIVASNAGGTQKGTVETFPSGEYYVAVGDSITGGYLDDISSDGIGYEPVLADLLTTSSGYPVAVANEGIGGTTSADGAASISSTLSKYPSAKYYLVLYGTNDADTFFGGPVSRETYKTNMQGIVSAIKAAGKTPYLAKVPYTSNPRYGIPSIQSYNLVIDELAAANGISATPPDFYALFQDTSLLDADGLHPNGTGYQSMANLWSGALVP